MSQVNDYAGNSIAGTLMSTDDAARMLQDLLRSVASIQAQTDEFLPQSPWDATSFDPSCSFLAPDAQTHAPLDHNQLQIASTLLHPIGGIPDGPSQHAPPPSLQIPHVTGYPSWAFQGIPPSTVAPQDTWLSKTAPEAFEMGLPSYQGRSAIDMSLPPMQPHLGSYIFPTGLEAVPPPFQRADKMSAQPPYLPSPPPISHFLSRITSWKSRDGRSGNPTRPSSFSAMKTEFSIAPTVSDPPPKATASPSCEGPSGKPIYLPPTYEKLQGEKAHEFRLVSIDSTIEAARTPTEEKVCTPVDNDWLKTDAEGRITFYDPHHPMSQPILFGTQLRLCEDTTKENHPEGYRCRYKDPAVNTKECGRTFGWFSNWQRHFGSTHVKDEHKAINRGDLDVSRAVAVKHGRAAIQVIECCSCKWRSQVGDRLDMVWKRHLMSEHGVVFENLEDKPSVKKRPCEKNDDKPSVKKRPCEKNDDKPSVKKRPRAKKDKPSSNKRPRDESNEEPTVNKRPRRESNDKPSVKKRPRAESNPDTRPQANGTELEGPPQAKKRRTYKRR